MSKTVLRFMVCSDLHFEGTPDDLNKQRFEKGLRELYTYADAQEYKSVDAIYVVGDFANHGTWDQMRMCKDSLDRFTRPETLKRLSISSHEYSGEGKEDGGRSRFTEVFGMPLETHEVIKGFHFIMVSSTDGTHFYERQLKYAKQELDKAHADTPCKPVFFFQHPHIIDTVYGSIKWGDKGLVSLLANYPQIVDFSGHSHAPINDPRSIHQYHFTSVGTGAVIGQNGGIEMDDFDKEEGTYPLNKREGASFDIVEVDEKNGVTIKPYDILTGRFFDVEWRVPTAWEPDSFTYTRDKRYREAEAPCFKNFGLKLVQNEEGVFVTFPQADGGRDKRVLDYIVTFRRNGVVDRRVTLWSSYYLNDLPSELTKKVTGLAPGKYTVTVQARGFWENMSSNRLEGEMEVE